MTTSHSPSTLRFGIVGTGMIATVVANAISKSKNARLEAVSSRRLEKALSFVSERPGTEAVQGVDTLLGRTDVDAIYLAIPTAAKEEIALAAIAAGKHVLVDKPFLSASSVQRLSQAAEVAGVLFMDATHFVHHPRTAAIRQAIPKLIGSPRSLHTAFYFPISDTSNIRFDPTLEPTGALGDMAWYSMRAVFEYLQPQGKITKAVLVPEYYPQTGAVIRVSGVIAFETGEASTFDAGFTAGTALLDLQLLGTHGVLSMDDFVLNWSDSFAFNHPDIPTGYFHRSGMASRADISFIPTPSHTPQEVLMIETFAALSLGEHQLEQAHFAEATLRTQEYLDALRASSNF
jgi:predicted dehydrogenase